MTNQQLRQILVDGPLANIDIGIPWTIDDVEVFADEGNYKVVIEAHE